MATAYLGLGGNLGDVRATFARAIAGLQAGGARVVARSSDYRTPPWGKTDQPAYVNACVGVDTVLAPRALLELCLKVEADLGRVRLEKWGPRLIDIDVLTYADAEVHEHGLAIPHPYMLERAFVLLPLVEIAPDLVVHGTPIRAALERLDRAGIETLPPA